MSNEVHKTYHLQLIAVKQYDLVPMSLALEEPCLACHRQKEKNIRILSAGMGKTATAEVVSANRSQYSSPNGKPVQRHCDVIKNSPMPMRGFRGSSP